MKMQMTVVFEYQTGADDTETFNGYQTPDPEECAAIDREAVAALGGVLGFIYTAFDKIDVASWKIEPVTE